MTKKIVNTPTKLWGCWLIKYFLRKRRRGNYIETGNCETDVKVVKYISLFHFGRAGDPMNSMIAAMMPKADAMRAHNKEIAAKRMDPVWMEGNNGTEGIQAFFGSPEEESRNGTDRSCRK